MMKKRLAVIVTFLLLLSLAGCNSVSGSGKTVIEVNGKKITQKQYDERYSILKANYELQSGSKLDESKDKETIKSLKETAYNNLVLQELIVEDAKKQGVDASTKEIDTRLASFKENQNKYSVDGYKLFLEKLNLTEAKLRDELKIQILSEKMQAKVAGNTTVSDAEVKKYYDDNQSEFKQAGGIQIYHILVSDEKLAKDIITKIKAGQDFAALAKQYSTDRAVRIKAEMSEW
jgi:parvulin-like peptidyl-prolyl isomerase